MFLAPSYDGTFSRKRKVPLMKHSDISMLQKILCLEYLKQYQYKALSGNSCSGTLIKFILFYFIL